MKYKNLALIGTSHIARQSLEDVKAVIENEKPSIICLELDKRRAFALLHSVKSGRIKLSDIRKIGFKGYFFSLLGAWAERKLGETVGVKPGEEMKTAMLIARQHNLKVNFIDQDIEITLKRLTQALSWREKWNFVVDIGKGLVLKERKYMFDLTKVPSKTMVSRMIKEVKNRYPNLYHVLVVERNHFMAKRLIRLMKAFPDKKIVAFVGAGHEEDMVGYIKRNLHTVDVV